MEKLLKRSIGRPDRYKLGAAYSKAMRNILGETYLSIRHERAAQ